MEAIFDGQNYSIILDHRTKEIEKLGKKPLKTSLIEKNCKTENSIKTFSLEKAENNGKKGLELKCFPVDCERWEELDWIQLKINKIIYSLLCENEKIEIKYDEFKEIQIMKRDSGIYFINP